MADIDFKLYFAILNRKGLLMELFKASIITLYIIYVLVNTYNFHISSNRNTKRTWKIFKIASINGALTSIAIIYLAEILVDLSWNFR